MSDQYHWKKEGERNDRDLFCAAYEMATGASLTVVAERERPDFVCERDDEVQVGVELTKIIAHPETRQWHRLFGSGAMDSTREISTAIFKAAFEKASKLGNAGWERHGRRGGANHEFTQQGVYPNVADHALPRISWRRRP